MGTPREASLSPATEPQRNRSIAVCSGQPDVGGGKEISGIITQVLAATLYLRDRR